MFWGKLIPLPLQDLALMSLSTSKLVHPRLPPCPAQKWSCNPVKINETWGKGWGTSRKGVLNSSERAMEASKLSPSLSPTDIKWGSMMCGWRLAVHLSPWGAPAVRWSQYWIQQGSDEKNLRFLMTSLSCHVKHHWGIPAGGPVK